MPDTIPITIPITNPDTNAFLQAETTEAALLAIGAEPKRVADENYITDAEKAALHEAEDSDSIIAALGFTPLEATEAAVLDKIGDGTRIGAEFMPEVIEGVLFELDEILPETILPARTLAANADGDLVIGDDVTAGGRVIGDSSRTRYVGSIELTEVQLDAAVQRQLGTFEIPAAKAIIGTVIRMRGRFSQTFLSALPSANGIGFAGNGITPSAIAQCVSVRPTIAQPGETTQVHFDFSAVLGDNTTNLNATLVARASNAYSVTPITISEGNFGIVPTGTPSYTQIPVFSPITPLVPVVAGFNIAKDTNQSLKVYDIEAASSAATGASISYDFELSFE
jgi:hypothetical protein